MYIIRYFTLLTLLVSCGLSAMDNNQKVLAVRNAGSYEAYLAGHIPALQNGDPYIKQIIQDYVNVGVNARKQERKTNDENLKKEVADAARVLNPDVSKYCGLVTGAILFNVLMEYTFPKPDPILGIYAGAVSCMSGSGMRLLIDLLDKRTRNALNVVRKHPSLYLKTNNKFNSHGFDFCFGFAVSGITVGAIRIILLNEFPFTPNFPLWPRRN